MSDAGDDLELIKAINGGRRDAFALLVSKYQVKIRGYCLHMLLDRGAAEDAAQEVFLKAYRHLDGFRSESRFSTWLFQIAVNHCRDLRRRKFAVSETSWDALREYQQERLAALDGGSSLLQRCEARDLVMKSLAHLSPEHREVLTLREAHGYRYDEIAELLHCSLDAVKARLRRARVELAEHSRHFFDEGQVKVRRGGP